MAAMERLPRQVVHNDGHAGNLLRTDESSDRVTGLIDFGDLVHTVTVADVAVSAPASYRTRPIPRRRWRRWPPATTRAARSRPTRCRPSPTSCLARLVLSTLLVEYQLANVPHLAAHVAAERPGTHAALARWLDIDPARAAAAIAERL